MHDAVDFGLDFVSPGLKAGSGLKLHHPAWRVPAFLYLPALKPGVD